MISDIQNNKEQLEMLFMTLDEVHHGICLFQSRNQAEWVSLIKKGLGEKKVVIHNIADDDEKHGMISSQDFRKWASESDAPIVIVYNIQLLGLRFGDEKAIEKLNFMRDQILAIGKMFVFGVSPYFNLLLSRKARDLYSCILHHFVFQEPVERLVGMRDSDMPDLSGDDVWEMERYRELKERIQNSKGKKDIPTYLACIKSWNALKEYIPYQEKEFITAIAEEMNEQYADKKIEITDLENIWLLAATWIELEKAERSVPWYEKALNLVREKTGNEHELYADALVEYTNYYKTVSNYTLYNEFCDHAIKIYTQKNMEYSPKGRIILQRKAILARILSKFDEALEIYNVLLDYNTAKYGKKYYGNASLYINIGRVQEEQGDLSSALRQYEKALELLNNTGKQGGWIAAIYQNICAIYIKSGDGNKAWQYIKKAKRIIEDIYGNNSSHLIDIYNNMSGAWSVRGQPDRELEYLKKAIDLIKINHMEKSEAAAYIYYNMGEILCLSGAVNDAVFYCKCAISIWEKIHGEKNELTAKTYEMLGYIFCHVPNPIEAKKNIDKAKSIYVSLYGSRCGYVERIEEALLYVNDLKSGQ